jgi:hypothetical protein
LAWSGLLAADAVLLAGGKLMEPQTFATLLRNKRFKNQRKFRLIGAVVCVLLFAAQSVASLAMAIWAQGKLDDTDIPGYHLLLLAARYNALALFFGAATAWAIGWLVAEATRTRLDYVVFELIDRVEKVESQTPESRVIERA